MEHWASTEILQVSFPGANLGKLAWLDQQRWRTGHMLCMTLQ